MKIGIVTAHHHSETFSPNGNYYTDRLVESLKYINYDYTFYLLDNQSTPPYDVGKLNSNTKYTYIKDQSIRGITGAWNDGLLNAINDGCDIVFQVNYDVELNEDINTYIKLINENKFKDNAVFGPVTNGQTCDGPQRLFEKSNKILISTQSTPLNGFMFGFTKEVYHKYKHPNGMFFEENPTTIWAGQEEADFVRIKKLGCVFIILTQCWFHHDKLRGWKKAKRYLSK